MLTAHPLCRGSVLITRDRPHCVGRACNVGSDSTWQFKTRTDIGQRDCEKGILLPLWNARSGGRWQGKTRTNIDQRKCKNGILRTTWSVGSDSKWQWKTRTNIGQKNCKKDIPQCVRNGIGWQWKTRRNTVQGKCEKGILLKQLQCSCQLSKS